MIAFSSLVISAPLNLTENPVITDVTFTVFEKVLYLSTSVVHSPELNRHANAFAGILNCITSHHFAQYFMALFLAYDIKFSQNDFLGVIMDFSDAQRTGFLKAYEHRTSRSDGLKCIKVCTVHCSRSLEKVAKICQGQKGGYDKAEVFKKAVQTLRTISSKEDYKRKKKKIRKMFPVAKAWIEWWNRREFRSTMFAYKTKMNSRLLQHPTRSTNAVESFHNDLYYIFNKRKPLTTNLEKSFFTLKMMKQHGNTT